MLNANYIIFYVNDPRKSAEFYQKLFNLEPLELSDTFALFQLKNDLKLGLWLMNTVEPKTIQTGGGHELGLMVTEQHHVDETYGQWKTNKVTILQQPTLMDFGYTFVGLDPDNHRLRVFYLIK